MTSEQFQGLSPAMKFAALIDELNDCADRCNENSIVANSWISHSFSGAADCLGGLMTDIMPLLVNADIEFITRAKPPQRRAKARKGEE